MKKPKFLEQLSRDQDFEDEEPREQPEDLEISAADFEDLLVAPSDWTLETLVKQIGRQIDLAPGFQRRGVWSPAAKASFIESWFLGIPIPQVLLAAKKDNRNSFIVLDGKQRLLTLKQFVDGELEDGKPFRLKGLRVLKALEGKTWQQISEDEQWADKFLNTTQRTAVLRGWVRDDVLYEIFHRLNSGSVKLSPMELRMSLHPGDFLKFVIAWSENLGPVHQLLRLQRPDKRMADVELAIRFLAFDDAHQVYDGNLKRFLDDLCAEYNNDFTQSPRRENILRRLKEFDTAIEACLEIFGDGACRKWKGTKYERSFNRAVFDIQIGSLSQPKLRTKALNAPAKFEELFQRLSESDNDFVRSLETTTKSVDAVNKRFGTWYNIVGKEFGVKLTPPTTKE